MTRYLLRRLVHAAFVLWAAFTVSFGLLYLLPTDPVSTMALGGAGGAGGGVPSAAQIAALRKAYGFDRPLPEQYLSRLAAALHGDFGTSVQTGQSVTRLIADALPQTLQLAAAALLAALLGASVVALATVRALPLPSWYGRASAAWFGRGLRSLPAVGVSAPSFWVGLLLIQFFSFRWRLLPAVGNDGRPGLVLPALTLALPTGAILAQVLTRSLITALGEPYIQTALATGAGPARVLFRHALRNASIPALTVAGLLVGDLMAGAVTVETVFSRTGIGRATATAVSTQDIPTVQGLVVFGALVFTLVSLALDLLVPLVDPRIARTAGASR
ncbi:ABC transporter permease [Protofrankia symbiont of Coriaria ruscifolia]|uniref:ABC transporter permease n=1 Tax=Protofrankia symbiont of Coriaria ruscifolia TaxID=1306542 RepID=UPI0010410232|nr:ABC transporter permease [Protofrankia symbiont of Coriaria ruscifolia]